MLYLLMFVCAGRVKMYVSEGVCQWELEQGWTKDLVAVRQRRRALSERNCSLNEKQSTPVIQSTVTCFSESHMAVCIFTVMPSTCEVLQCM